MVTARNYLKPDLPTPSVLVPTFPSDASLLQRDVIVGRGGPDRDAELLIVLL